jgi:hypothetical protein
MRRWLTAAVVIALHSAPVAQSGQDRPTQADAVVRLLADLENAIASGSLDRLRALASGTFTPDQERPFVKVTRGGQASAAIVRESSRRPLLPGSGYEIVADILVNHGRNGRLTTWQVTVEPHRETRDRFQLSAIAELASVDGLVKLALDPAKQFAVKHLTLKAPDFTLTMESGSAFVGEADDGVTAMVLRGRGRVQFAPPDPAEQGQLQLFAGKSAFDARIDSAFIRVNPLEFAARVPEGSLTPVAVDRLEFRRAKEIFDEQAPLTYNIDLTNLTADQWYLEPSADATVVEFRTSDGWLTYARSPAEPEDVTFISRARSRHIAIYASAEKLLRRGPTYSEDDDAAYDVLEYGVDATFDPVRSWIAGRGSLKVRIRTFAVTSLQIKLAPPLSVTSVTSVPFGRLLSLRVTGQNTVLITLPRPVDRGEEITLAIAYSGRLDPQKLDREAIAVAGRLIAPQDPAPIVLTPEPRFMYSNRVAWYPQAQVTDYATATLRLTVPSEYQVVASGTPRGSSVNPIEGGERGAAPRFARTVEYVAERPVRYLACIISRFVPVSRTRVDLGSGAGVNLEVISTPRMAGRNRRTADLAAAILRYYANVLGEAAYPDFTLATLDDNLPGGQSPPYFAILHQELATSPYSWADDPVAFASRYPTFFLAHEIAHQWWGHAIGWKNYHEQWLSEGIAQYFAALYAEKDRGPALMKTLIGDMRNSAKPLVPQGPIALGYRLGHLQSDGRIFRGIVYNKSAVVMHMLRQLIGDEAFFAGLKAFYKTWKFQKAGTADLRAAFETASGMKLDRFFDRWIGGATMPRIRLTSEVAPDGRSAHIRITQLGETFELPITVAVQYADGTSEEVLIKVTEATVEQRIPLKSPVRRIAVDDDLTLVQIVR